MNLFLIAIDDDNEPDSVHEIVSKKYPETNFRLSKLTWIVASDATSAASIRQNIGINAEIFITGIVASIDDYSGYASKDLWRLVADWEQS